MVTEKYDQIRRGVFSANHNQGGRMVMIFFLLSFMVLGAGIKYIDDAFDEETFSKKLAYISAPLLGLLWSYTMLIDAVAATILLAIVLGVFFKGKIDNLAHLAGMGIIFLVVILAGIELLFPILLLFAAAALTDELGNDYIDQKKKMWKQNKLNQFIIGFFSHRWTLKVAILFVSVLGIIPGYFFIAMICFDYAYLTVGLYGKVKQDSTQPVTLKKIIATIAVFNR